MLFNLFNAICIVFGGIIGTFLKKGIPERIKNSLIKAMGVCVMYIGISLALKGENVLIIVISTALGTLFGEFINFDELLNKFGVRIQAKFTKSSSKDSSDKRSVEGFIVSSILFCAGAMGVVGSLNVGLTGNGDTLVVKGLIDGIFSALFSSIFGVGVAFSSIPVFLYQNIFVLLASFLSHYLSDPVIASVSGVGGIAVLAIGINLVLDKDIKVANITPAVFIPMILSIFGIV